MIVRVTTLTSSKAALQNSLQMRALHASIHETYTEEAVGSDRLKEKEKLIHND